MKLLSWLPWRKSSFAARSPSLSWSGVDELALDEAAFTVLDLLCVWAVHHLGVVHDGGYLLRTCGIEIEQMVGFF